MKKKISVFILLTNLIIANSYEFEDIINMYKEVSYSTQYEVFEYEKLEIKSESIDKIDRNGLDLTWDTNYSTRGKESGETTIRVDYDFLNFKTTYDYLESDLYGSVGVEKDIKDFFYGERDYRSSLYETDKIITINNLEKEREQDIIDIINIYKNYQNNLLESELNISLKDSLYSEYKRLEKSYELGSSSELDYKYSKAKYESLLKDIKNLEENQKNLIEELSKKYNITLEEEANLLPFDVLDKYSFNLDNIGLRQIETLALEKKNIEINNSYISGNDTMPNMIFGADYFIDSSDWQVNFTLKKSFFNFNENLASNEVDMKVYDLKEIELEDSINLEKSTLQNKYQTLIRDIDKLVSEVEVKEMEYLIYQKRYEQGTVSYIDYIDRYDNYRDIKTSLIKKENDLSALLLEINYRR